MPQFPPRATNLPPPSVRRDSNPGASGATSLDSLSDVVAPSPNTDDVLTFNGATWVAQAPVVAGDDTADYLQDVMGIVTPQMYGAVGNGTSTTIEDAYGSLAAGIVANPSWSTVTDLAGTDLVDYAAIQAAFNDTLAWSKLIIPQGVFYVNKTITLPLDLSDLNIYGKTVEGINRNSSQIVQITDNTPILSITTPHHTISIKSLQLRYANQQDNTDTDAIGLQLYENPSANGGLYWSLFEDLQIDGSYRAIDWTASDGTSGSGMWGCVLNRILINRCTNTALHFVSPVVAGWPTVYCTDIQIHNTGGGPSATGAAVVATGVELTINHLDVEGWQDAVGVFGGGGWVHLNGVHIESHNMGGDDRWQTAFPYLFYIANGELDINHVQFSTSAGVTGVGSLDPGGYIRIFNPDADATLRVNDFVWVTEDPAIDVEFLSCGATAKVYLNNCRAGFGHLGTISFPAYYWDAPSHKAVVSLDGMPTGVYSVESFGAKGDGTTDDTTSFVDTVNARVYAGGGVVLVPNGTYLVKASSVSFPAIGMFQQNDIIFRGVGVGSIIKLDATTASNTSILRIWGDDCAVEDITFDLNGETDAIAIQVTTSNRTRIERCRIKSSGSVNTFGVFIGGSVVDLKVDRNSMFNVAWGIYSSDVTGTSDLHLTNNQIDGNGLTGDGIEINQPTTAGVSDVHSIGNTITGYITSGNNGMGIGYARVIRGTISGNTIYDVGLDGIHIEDAATDILVQGNVVYDCGRSGISVQTGSGSGPCFRITIKGNNVTGCCVDNGDGGIAVEGSAAQTQIIVEGNTSYANGRSGATGYAFALWLEDSIVVGNQGWNTVGTTTAGMLLAGSSLTVAHNRCGDTQGTKTQDHGFVLHNLSNAEIYDNDGRDNGVGVLSFTGTSTRAGVGILRDNMGDAGNTGKVDVRLYGAIGDGSSHLLSTRYASTAAAIAANPAWSTVTGLALTHEIDWAAWQAALNDWANWGTLTSHGTFVVNDTVIEPSNGTDFMGRIIAGSGRETAIILQTEDNLPIVQTEEGEAHSVIWKDLQLKYNTPQTASDTASTCFSLYTSLAATFGTHYFRKWENMRFVNGYNGIAAEGEDGTVYAGSWGGVFENLYFNDILNTAIKNYSPNFAGLPVNSYRNIQIHNSDSRNSIGPALELHSGEHQFTGLDVERWNNNVMYAFGGCTIAIRGLHVEWHEFTGSTSQLFHFTDQGTFVIEDAGISIDVVNVSDHIALVHAGANANVTMRDWMVNFRLAVTAGFTSLVRPQNHGGDIRIEDIKISNLSVEQFDFPIAMIGWGYDDYFYRIRLDGYGIGEFAVTSFGAKGDGTTDDTTAIQAAINFCGAAGGGTVYFPPGLYLLESATQNAAGGNPAALVMSYDNVVLRGAGSASQLWNNNADISSVPVAMFCIGGAAKGARLATGSTATWYDYSLTGASGNTPDVYNLTGSYVKGERTISLDTGEVAAGGFVVGDWILIRTGMTLDGFEIYPTPGQPDAEINRIEAIDGDDIDLYWPLGKPYQQEYHIERDITSSSVANPSVITTSEAHNLSTGETVDIAGHSGSTPDINGEQVVTVLSSTTFSIPVNVTVGGTGGTMTRQKGATTTTVTSNPALYGITKATDRLLLNCRLEDFHIINTTGASVIIGGYTYGTIFSRLTGIIEGAGLESFGCNRGHVQQDCVMHSYNVPAGGYAFSPDAGSSDCRLLNTTITGTGKPFGVHIHEGAANILVQGNTIRMESLAEDYNLVSIRQRAYDVSILDNYFQGGGLTAIYANETGVVGGIIDRNIFSDSLGQGAITLAVGVTGYVIGEQNIFNGMGFFVPSPNVVQGGNRSIPLEAFSLVTGTATLEISSGELPRWSFPHGSLSNIGTSFVLPSTWKKYDVYIGWAGLGAGTDATGFGLLQDSISAGESILNPSPEYSSGGDTTPTAEDILSFSKLSAAPITNVAGSIQHVRIYRNDSAPTNPIGVFSVELVRTA